jgi:hypothetical protein
MHISACDLISGQISRGALTPQARVTAALRRLAECDINTGTVIVRNILRAIGATICSW